MSNYTVRQWGKILAFAGLALMLGCSDDSKKEDICSVDGSFCNDDETIAFKCTNGIFELLETCTDGFVCKDAKCQMFQDDTACGVQPPRCSSSNSYQVCEDGKWSDPQTCTSGQVCAKGECVNTQEETQLPCAKPGETRCVGTSRLQFCNDSKKWSIYTCPSGIEYCDPDEKECVAPKCKSGEKSCSPSGLLRTCEDYNWKSSLCPSETPVCKNGECVVKQSECVNGAKKCHSINESAVCVNGEWKTSACKSGEVCTNTACAVSCNENEKICQADGRTLCTCKNGTLSCSLCPSSAPYCTPNGNACLKLENNDNCDNYTMGSFCVGNALYSCIRSGIVITNDVYNNLNNTIPCQCIQQKDKQGAYCKDDRELQRCTSIGETRIAETRDDYPRCKECVLFGDTGLFVRVPYTLCTNNNPN